MLLDLKYLIAVVESTQPQIRLRLNGLAVEAALIDFFGVSQRDGFRWAVSKKPCFFFENME